MPQIGLKLNPSFIPSPSVHSNFIFSSLNPSFCFFSTYYTASFPSLNMRDELGSILGSIPLSVPSFLLSVTHPSTYLLGGDPRSLPPRPPAFHHGNEAGEHHASCQHTENTSEAVDVQGVATLSCLDWAVEVTGAVLGPPLEFQYIHVTVLLELQDSRM